MTSAALPWDFATRSVSGEARCLAGRVCAGPPEVFVVPSAGKPMSRLDPDGSRGGQVFTTAMGHTRESYAEPLFRAHLLAGLRWAAGL